MIILYSISALLVLLYLMYPLWLMLFTRCNDDHELETDEIKSVSLILLSHNGRQYLEEKINFLLKELSVFKDFEMLIIDDHSSDGSQELLSRFEGRENIRLMLQERHMGIPHSMNMGIHQAQNKHIIFCDQRQRLSENIIQKIVEPLRYKQVGAVSGCISHLDKSQCCSWVRKHENYIKSIESKSGNLIGVYGPFYAIKKDCYSPIPDDIVLDDLYLSIKIIQSKQVRILTDCRIIEDGFSALYDYKRAKRYVLGFLQLLKERNFIRPLKLNQVTMLFWHKYLRLLIPISLFISYIGTGIKGITDIEYMIAFLILTMIGSLSLIPRYKIKFKLANLICVNIFYLLALSDITLHEVFYKKA